MLSRSMMSHTTFWRMWVSPGARGEIVGYGITTHIFGWDVKIMFIRIL
jgi:hypothetical protein